MAASPLFPLTALVGLDDLRLALTLVAVNPRLAGVLVRGEKGTAKSTAARALAALLPPAPVNQGCPYGCAADRPERWCDGCRGREHPVVERPAAFETLPLGVTEDQLLGSLDLEAALQRGERRFEPGLLARVNGGVLYVDEVNLLDDHVVDVLLDVAAMGVNTVAREGVSVTHPAEFALVGTMNPEEGELRPQLLDRFGLCVEVRGLSDVDARAEIVLRRLDFERDPTGFRARYEAAERALGARIAAARARRAEVRVGRGWCRAAASLALQVGVDGHRADLMLVEAAATLAALDGRVEVGEQDLVEAAALVLPHRLRRRPFDAGEAPDGDALRATAREAARGAARETAEEDPKG